MRSVFGLANVLVVCLLVGCSGGDDKQDDAGKKDDKAAAKTGDDKKSGADGGGSSSKKTGDSEKPGTPPPADKPGVITLTPENTKITFTGTKDDGKHDGGFKAVSGEIHLGEDGVKTIDVTIETNSLFSDDKKLTEHLLSPDFFEVTSFPKASLASSKIEAAEGDATYTVTADLTLRGVTKTLEIPVKVDHGDGNFKLSSEFEISRKDFGFDYSHDKIHDPVKIQVEIDTTAN